MEHQKRISEEVIGCALTVSNRLGSGFLESVYENALAVEMASQDVEFTRQKPLKVSYKEQVVGNFYADFVVAGKLILELKSTNSITREHEAQLLNYLHAASLQVGLILNFGMPKLGIKRIVNNYLGMEPI